MLAFIKFKRKPEYKKKLSLCFFSEREERGLISRKAAGNRANLASRTFLLPFSKGKLGDGTGRDGTGRGCNR